MTAQRCTNYKAEVFRLVDGKRTVRQIADALGAKPQTVGQILRRAEQRHLAPKTNKGAGMWQEKATAPH